MTKEQRSADTVVTLLQLPRSVSLDLSRRCLDMRESGMKMSKVGLIQKYIEMGLKADAPGLCEPVR